LVAVIIVHISLSGFLLIDSNFESAHCNLTIESVEILSDGKKDFSIFVDIELCLAISAKSQRFQGFATLKIHNILGLFNSFTVNHLLENATAASLVFKDLSSNHFG